MSTFADLLNRVRLAPKRPAPLSIYHRQSVLVLDEVAASCRGFRKITDPYRDSELEMLERAERSLDMGGIGHCRVRQSEIVQENKKSVRITGFTLWRK